MIDRATKLRSGGHQIAGQLVPHAMYRDEHFWCEHWPTLCELMSLKAILQERRYFFEKSPSRANAISLIVFIDMAWQVARGLGRIKGSDGKWFEASWLKRSRDATEAFKLLQWTYELHSALRHPQSNWPQYAWLLSSPWPTAEAQRLVEAAAVIGHVLLFLDVGFNPEAGFEGDVAEKRVLASKAAAFWSSKLSTTVGTP